MADTYKGASRESLYQLYALLLDALLAELSKPEASAALLGVARKLLRDSGVTAEMAGMADLRRSLGELRSLSVPFVKPVEDKEPEQ